MTYFLEKLNATRLSHMEAGQLIRRHLADLGTIDPSLQTDAPYNDYVLKIGSQSSLYEKALAQIQKSEQTQAIHIADKVRDKSVTAFGYGIKLYSVSDDPEEAEAARGLQIIYSNFKGMTILNYEAESLAVDKMVSELEKPTNAAKVEKLNLGRYVTRMKSANGEFKTLFSTRIVAEASTESYDMKSIRQETFKLYSEFCKYVLAMAKATKSPLFTQALSLLNTARKYYADRLAQGNKKEEQKPTEA